MNRFLLFFGLAVIAVAFLLAILLFFLGKAEPPGDQLSLTQAELADLVRPAIVRVVQHVRGTARIPEVSIDLRARTVALIPGGIEEEVPIDEYILGSGFIVNPQGVVVTNAHVASDATAKLVAITPYFVNAVSEAQFRLTPEEQKRIERELDSEEGELFGQEILRIFLEYSTFSLKKDLRAFDPSSWKKQSLEGLAESGLVLGELYLNENFLFDDKDVAVLKLPAQDMRYPAVALAKDPLLVRGTRVYIFGFPATAEFNRRNLLEPSFTTGIVGALKDSQNRDFHIYQTDAKISQGSSGGPLLNEGGEVAGIVTFQTDVVTQQAGDNFAFALPVSLLKTALGTIDVSYDSGEFASHFKAGLVFRNEQRCKQAIDEFSAARTAVDERFVPPAHLEGYITECRDLIASGQSVDTVWDVVRQGFFDAGFRFWMMVSGGITALFLVGILLVRMRRRMRMEEVEIKSLEERVAKDEALIAKLLGPFRRTRN